MMSTNEPVHSRKPVADKADIVKFEGTMTKWTVQKTNTLNIILTTQKKI